jgi:2-polyprenyl-6-methoxyphenol hydroxylase-like FAD-dependent oxidoreductase
VVPTADVAIVGYGPVGQLLAILLGERGWRVRVLERWSEPYPLPRAVHFDHEVARILQGAGVMPALEGRSESASLYEWRNRAGEVLLRIGRDAERSLSGWPESTMFCQPELERALDARVAALPSVTLERGAEVVAARDEVGFAELEAKRADGTATTLRARHAVGCDGARSFVRGALGSEWIDLGFHFDWLVVDVIPREARRFEPANWQLCDPARPTTLVSGGPGRRRFEFMRLPGESLADLDSDEAAWRLLAPWDVHPGDARLERRAVYRFGARWADRWRRGRLLIAGDAAHQMPPFAGQGLCAGLRDAANLAWKLDLVLAGRAPESLLESYPGERAPHVRAMIELSVQLGRVICVADPAEAAERDRRMVAELAARHEPVSAPQPRLGPGIFAAGSEAAGRPFLQGRVAGREGASGRFDDVVGRGWALVSPHADPAAFLSPELAAWFADLGGVCAHVGARAPLQDLDGSYARWFAKHAAGVALQRPDFIVFGTQPKPEDAGALVSALRDELAAER